MINNKTAVQDKVRLDIKDDSVIISSLVYQGLMWPGMIEIRAVTDKGVCYSALAYDKDVEIDFITEFCEVKKEMVKNG